MIIFIVIELFPLVLSLLLNSIDILFVDIYSSVRIIGAVSK